MRACDRAGVGAERGYQRGEQHDRMSTPAPVRRRRYTRSGVIGVYFDCVLPFWISIALLSVCQGVGRGAAARLVAGVDGALAQPPVGTRAAAVGDRVRGRGLGSPNSAAPHALTYIALVGVPLLAALALGWLMRGARPVLALLVAPLFALAWADRGGLAGEGAARRADGAQLCRARSLDRGRHARALAGGWDRGDGLRRRGAWSSRICCRRPTTRSMRRIRWAACRTCRPSCSARR